MIIAREIFFFFNLVRPTVSLSLSIKVWTTLKYTGSIAAEAKYKFFLNSQSSVSHVFRYKTGALYVTMLHPTQHSTAPQLSPNPMPQ